MDGVETQENIIVLFDVSVRDQDVLCAATSRYLEFVNQNGNGVELIAVILTLHSE